MKIDQIIKTATDFAEMNPDEKAIFFNWLYMRAGSDDPLQIDECLKSNRLLDGGKKVIESFKTK